jgi:hypothetical protein
MFARTLAGLIVVIAVVTLGYLAVSAITPSATTTLQTDEIHQQPAVRAPKRPITGVLILGNLITALVYALLYGFAAGAFN